MSLTLEQIRQRCTEEGDCWLWNQGLTNTGYPQARIDGKNWLVSRYVYGLLGKTVRKGYCLATKCQGRACLSPICLKSITFSERMKRAYETGSRCTVAEYLKRQQMMVRQGRTKLDHEKAEQIRARVSEKGEHLAKEFGVHPKTIYDIRRGNSWKRSAKGASIFNMGATR